MNHVLFARLALSALCAMQAIATAAIDFNRTHATNPLWIGHARFHVVWQSSTIVILSAVELALVWAAGPAPGLRFYTAVLLSALSPLGFLSALATRKLYGGTLSDPNGIPPARLPFRGSVRAVDMNTVAVVAALLSLGVIIVIYRG